MLENDWASQLKADLDKLTQVAAPIITKEKQPAAMEVYEKLQEGERRNVAILFLDIQGFTSMAEKLDPEELHLIMDTCFKVFTKVIEKYGGYVDKYEGDRIMALFGISQSLIGSSTVNQTGQDTGSKSFKEKSELTLRIIKQSTEKDTEMAIRTALELHENLENINNILKSREIKLGMRIGINTGLVVAGKVGKGREGDYTVMGDAVNLASRLEDSAPVGSILISAESRTLAGDIFLYEDQGAIEFKGKSQPIQVFRVKALNPKRTERWQRSRLTQEASFIGREKEIDLIREAFSKCFQKKLKHQVVTLVGPAGMGKSRLVYEFLREIKSGSTTSFYAGNNAAECSAKGTEKILDFMILKANLPPFAPSPYELFSQLVKGHLSAASQAFLDSLGEESTASESSFERKWSSKYACGATALQSFLKDLVTYLPQETQEKYRSSIPFIYYVMGVAIPNEEEAIRIKEMDPKSLNTEIRVALWHLIEVLAEQAFQKYGNSLILFLDDMENCEDASASTLSFILENAKTTLPLFVLILSRPAAKLPKIHQNYSDLTEIELNPLNNEQALDLVNSMLPGLEIPEKAKNFLFEKAAGNPFFLEELIHTLLVQEIIVLEAFSTEESKSWKVVQDLTQMPLPDTVNGIILHRLDLLEAACRETIKFASVIGREFLSQILDYIWERVDLRASQILSKEVDISIYLEELVGQNLILPKILPAGPGYVFRHLLTMEVAYSIILNYNKRILHGLVAKALEEIFQDSLQEHYSVLAHHWNAAENWQKASHYFFRAGEKAKASYENKLALEYLKKSAEIIENKLDPKEYSEQLFEAFKSIGEIYKLLGHFEEAREAFDQALTLAKNLDENAEVSSKTREIDVLNEIIITYYHQGNFQKGYEFSQASAELSEKYSYDSGLAASWGHLGIYYHTHGDWHQALDFMQKSLELRRKIKNQAEALQAISSSNTFIKYDLGIASALNNIATIYYTQGKAAEALDHFQQSQQIKERLNDKIAVSSGLGNIGNILLELGRFDDALKNLQASLKINKEIGRKMGYARNLNSIGNIHYLRSEYQLAQAFFEESLNLCCEIADLGSQAIGLGGIGNVYLDQGFYDKALEKYQESLNLRKKIGFKPGEGLILIFLAQWSEQIGDLTAAEAKIQEAIKILSATNSLELAFAYAVAGQIQLQLGKQAEAPQAIIEEAQNSLAATDNLMKEKICREAYIPDRLNRAHWQLTLKQPFTAQNHATMALQYTEANQIRRMIPACLVTMAEVLLDIAEQLVRPQEKAQTLKQAYEHSSRAADLADQFKMLPWQWKARISALKCLTEENKASGKNLSNNTSGAAAIKNLEKEIREILLLQIKNIPPNYQDLFNTKLRSKK